MKLIAIDTVTESCSAALLIDDQCLTRAEIVGNRHSSLILGMIDSLLAEAGISLASLDAVAFDRGPGSFTGLRIGAGVAQGVAFAVDLPVCGISSLASLAAASGHHSVLAAIDARMGQVYWALLEGSAALDETIDERLDYPVDVRIHGDGVHGVGSGWDAYGDILESATGRERIPWQAHCHPQAEWVARLAVNRLASGGGLTAELAVPVYLRDRVTG